MTLMKSYMNHFIAVVANSWLETLLTSIDFLPKDVIKREVDAYLLIKSLSPLIILGIFKPALLCSVSLSRNEASASQHLFHINKAPHSTNKLKDGTEAFLGISTIKIKKSKL